MEINVSGIEEVLNSFDEVITNSPKTIKKILKDSGLVVSRNTKKAIHKAANKGYSTGELEHSVYATEPRKNDLGSYVIVKPAGTDSKGVRNGAKWGYLQYGNGRGAVGHDFKSEAIKASQNDVMKIAEEAIKDLTRKLEV